MKRFSFLLLIFTIALFGVVQAEEPEFAFEQNPNAGGGTILTPSIEALWDMQFNFNLETASGALGNAGGEFDGTYYYTTRWASNLIHQYDMTGTLVQEFSIAGVTGLRDLAYDGTYFYGGAAANTIYIMDFTTQTLIGTIASPEGVRNIAYDSANDGFWVGNWTTDLFLVDRSGATLSTIPAATHALTSIYGSAYDEYSTGGPYLWLFHQGVTGAEAHVAQIDIATGMQTGVTHDMLVDFPATSPLAGGLWVEEGVAPGYASIGGVAQGTPDMFFALELTASADPSDPMSPENLTAYSDYSTPTSIDLNWTDPTTLVNGTAIVPGDFTIEIEQDGVWLVSVAGGTGTYTATGLTDGVSYDFTLYTNLTANDSTSSPVNASWTAGGSPVPDGPTALTITDATGGDLNASWTNPTDQTDGTPFDDFAGVYLYENGTLLTTFTRTVGDTGAADTDVFTPTTPNAEYWVTAFDNETPINESAASNSAWPPIGVPYLEDFENAVVGTPGTLPLLWTNETDDDFDWYVDAGGTGSSGTGPDVDHTLGTAAGQYMFTESSSPNYPSMIAHLTTPTLDISSLSSPGLAFWYHMCGATMGELHVDVYHNGAWVLDAMPALVGPQQAATSDPWLQAIVDLSPYTSTPIQVRFRGITGSSYTSDMAIDDVFFTTLSGNPTMVVAPQVLVDTLLIGETGTVQFNISNTQAAPTTLNFTIAEDPAVSWLSVTPDTGSVTTGNSAMIDVNLDATGLTGGAYTTDLIVAGSDTNNAADTVSVTLQVNDAPVIGISPTTFSKSLLTNQSTTDTLTISNTGAGPLNFEIMIEDVTDVKVLRSDPGSNLTVRPGVTDPEMDKAGSSLEGVLVNNIPDGYSKYLNRSEGVSPDLMYYKFNETGTTTTQNYAPAGTRVNDFATLMGGMTMGSSGQSGAALVGTGGSSSSDYVDTGWGPDVGTGDWAISLWLNNMDTGTTLYYHFGDVNTASFRCFSGGVAGAGNLILRGGGLTDIIVTGVGAGPVVVDFIYDSVVPEVRAYIDGVLNNVVPQSGVNLTGTGPFKIGGYSSSTGMVAGELMDEFKMWNTIPSFLTWLIPDTVSGTIPSGSSMDVILTFDATGFEGGDYTSNIVVTSNDPVNPTVTATAQLHVTGVADIGVSTTLMDWGTIFTSVNDTMTLGITNTGTDTLHVTGITNTTSEFTIVGATVFDLLIGETYDLPVIFNSAATGTFNDSLIIVSNAVNPAPTVYMTGTTHNPPVIVVDPTSVSDSLLSGQTSMHYFDVMNTGLSPLYFDITISGLDDADAKVDILGGNSQKSDKILASGTPVSIEKLKQMGSAIQSSIPVSAVTDKDAPHTVSSGIPGMNIVSSMENTDLEEVFGGITNAYNAGPRSRGNYFTCTTSTVLTEFRGYHNPSVATQMWFLVYEGTAQVGTYNLVSASDVSPAGPGEGWYSSGAINVPLTAGNFYLMTCQFEQITGYYNEQGIVPYPIPASFGELTAGAGYSTSPTSVFPPDLTQNVLATTFAEPVAYYQTIVTGASWLSTAPAADTVAVGDTVQVAVTFDATGANGGLYTADIEVNSNDPATPTVVVPASLHVTGVANIAVNPDALDFGFLFLGVADTMTFAVENPGTDDVNVTGFATSTADYSVITATPFTVAAGGSQDVEVVYSAAASGTHTDSVVITHDAPIVVSDVVQLTGETANPPIIVLSDTLLQHQMNEGEEDSTTMMIYNTGASTLDYELRLGNDPFMEASNYAGKPVDPSVAFNGKSETGPASNPGYAPAHYTGEAIWDVQLSFNLETASGALGNAGAEFDGTYFYSTRWASNLIHQYDATGALVQEFSIAGVTGLRDLAFDGTYFYGGAAANTIYIMDFVSQTLVGTITSPEGVRNIAYNEDLDAFYVGNWTTDIFLVDRNGNTLSTIPAASHALTSVYGSAYDNISDGGPYLWLFHQGVTGAEAHMTQIDLATGMQTGVTHDVLADLPASSPLAGGLFITTDLVPGKATIGGLAQGTPDMMICYELAEAASWVTLDHTIGSVAPGDSGSVMVYWHGVITEQIHDGYLGVYSNDPVTPVENIHLSLDVIMTSIGDGEEAMPTQYALHQNFPNPFNPSTTIKYDLKAKTDVKLTIYNVLGQKVRTLVNTNQAAGFKNIVWNGLNDVGEQVSTGIYIYRIEADGFVKSRKMVFMK